MPRFFFATAAAVAGLLLPAASCFAALDIDQACPTARETLQEEHVDVVVLDVHLHRERSDALVTECHARRPPIPVVLVTGSVDITHPGLSEADAVLPKPFELQHLLSVTRPCQVGVQAPLHPLSQDREVVLGPIQKRLPIGGRSIRSLEFSFPGARKRGAAAVSANVFLNR